MSNRTLTLNDVKDEEVRLLPRDQLFAVIQGDRPGDGTSRHVIGNVDEILIGRGRERSYLRRSEPGKRQLELRFPDARMSSAHARILNTPEGYRFEDLGSKNGSRVDGATVERTLLRDRSILELGLTTLVFRDGLMSREQGEDDLVLGPDSRGFCTLVPSIARDLDRLARIARSPVPVLLLGETGTGKEVTARAVHALSFRTGPFVAVNCAAIARELVEATLFGHKRGAYSGAVADNLGLVREADGGTLLLDEVGDLPLAAQAALLRVLQEGEVLPVGASRPVKVDVRILAATHRPVTQLVARGQMREDLYARLAGYVITLPALRERREDLGLLVSTLILRASAEQGAPLTLAPGTMAALLRHDFPRNIRELEKWVFRANALRGDGILRPESLEDRLAMTPQPDLTSTAENALLAAGAALGPQAPAPQRDDVTAALQKHRGNLAAVASNFRTSRSQVHRLLKRFGLNAEDFRQ
jgi:DNA-binding NtrC family response regulator